MHYHIARNELDDTIEINGKAITGGVSAELRCKMRDLGYTDMGALQDAYTAYAYRRSYHPVKRYLESLQWDGADHLDQLASHLRDNHPPIYYTHPATPYSDSTLSPSSGNQSTVHQSTVAKAWFLRFLIGAVARVYEYATLPAQPPMLVLDGPQGLGKSTLVRWLGIPLPQLTYEGPINPNYNETPRLQATRWIWEVSELGATTRHADREALKAIISTGDITFRVPYDRHPIRKPTLANFIGTINNEAGFLSDPTDNRRFLTMTLTHIDHAYYKQIDIHQLWAQIYTLYQKGEPWQLLPAESQMQSQLNQAYQIEDPLETWVIRYYEIDLEHSVQYQSERNQSWFVTTQEVAAYLTTMGFVGNTLGLQNRLGTTLKAMGLQDGRKQGTRGLRGYYGLRRRS